MPFKDFDVYWQIARALLQGANAYALPEAYYPLPFYFLFLPLATLPLPLAHALWTAIASVVFVVILRRRAIYALLFMPVLLSFLMGQIAISMLGVFALLRSGRFGGIALALLLLKPQLVILVAPWVMWRWWKSERRQFISFGLTLGALALAAFTFQPDWLTQWLAVSPERLRAALSPSLWGALAFLPMPLWIALAGGATILLVLRAWRTRDFDLIAVANFLVNPVIISYDLTLLLATLRGRWTLLLLTVVSWVCFAISAGGLVRGEGPFVLTTLAVLVVLFIQKRAAVRPRALSQCGYAPAPVGD